MYIPERDGEYFHEEAEKEEEYYENEFGEDAEIMAQVNRKIKPIPPPKPSYMTSPSASPEENQKVIENSIDEEEEEEHLHLAPLDASTSTTPSNIPYFGTIQIPSISFCILTGVILPIFIFPTLSILIWVFHSFLFERTLTHSIPMSLLALNSTHFSLQFIPSVYNRTQITTDSFAHSFEPFFTKFIYYHLFLSPVTKEVQWNISGEMDVFSVDEMDSQQWKWQSQFSISKIVHLSDRNTVSVSLFQIESLSQKTLLQASNFTIQSSEPLDLLPTISYQFEIFYFGFAGAQLAISLITFVFSVQLLLLYWKWYHFAVKRTEQKLFLVLLCLVFLYTLPLYSICYLFHWKWLEWITLTLRFVWLHAILIVWIWILLVSGGVEKNKFSIGSVIVIAIAICFAASCTWVSLFFLELIMFSDLKWIPFVLLVLIYSSTVLLGICISILQVLSSPPVEKQQELTRNSLVWMNFGLQISFSLVIIGSLIALVVFGNTFWTEFHTFVSFSLLFFCFVMCWLWRPSQTKILLDRSLLISQE